MWKTIGQEKAVSLVQRSLERGALSHAYLFVGPPHVGKMTLALDVARALNCESDERPCGRCAVCQKIDAGRHADVQIIGLIRDGSSPDARLQSEISIDQVRDMQHSANLPPFEGRYKVFIIDGAELLSVEAANCLLKTLEEPVGKAIFMLLTTNERLLLTTVVSRCQKVELLPLPALEIETFLGEQLSVEPARAKLLARLSHGCLGWAVLASENESVLEQRAEYLDELADITNTDYERRFAFVARLANQAGQNKGLLQNRLDLWQDWWRDLLLVKVGLADKATNIDRLALLTNMAGGYNLEQIGGFIKSIQRAGEQLKLNANAQLLLEVLMLDIPDRTKQATA